MKLSLLKPVIRTFIVLLFLGFSLVGADCSKLLNNGSDDIADVVGNWYLTQQTGAAYDVCDGESLIISADHTAILQCPGHSAITRTVTVSNGTLTYDNTGVEYNYEVTTTSGVQELTLTGSNVDRNLLYTLINAAAPPPASKNKDTKVTNSSDKLR